MPPLFKKRASSESWVDALSARRPSAAAPGAPLRTRERAIPPPPPPSRRPPPVRGARSVPPPAVVAQQSPPRLPQVAGAVAAKDAPRVQGAPNGSEHAQGRAHNTNWSDLPTVSAVLLEPEDATLGSVRPLDLVTVRKRLDSTGMASVSPSQGVPGEPTPGLLLLEDDLRYERQGPVASRGRSHSPSRWLGRALSVWIVVLGVVIADPVRDARQTLRLGRDAVLTLQFEAEDAARALERHPTTRRVLADANALLEWTLSGFSRGRSTQPSSKRTQR
jgi:hypothetical protein